MKVTKEDLNYPMWWMRFMLWSFNPAVGKAIKDTTREQERFNEMHRIAHADKTPH